jgi:hypothetical protein
MLAFWVMKRKIDLREPFVNYGGRSFWSAVAQRSGATAFDGGEMVENAESFLKCSGFDESGSFTALRSRSPNVARALVVLQECDLSRSGGLHAP